MPYIKDDKPVSEENTVCGNCRRRVFYIPADVHSRYCRDLDSKDTYYWVVCPKCKKTISVPDPRE